MASCVWLRSMRLGEIALVTLLSSSLPASAQTLGIFDSHSDVGRVRSRGTVAYDPVLQQYTVTGSGTNMWNARDDFHFAWKKLSGNFILSLRARFVGKGVEEHRKVGWTIRPSFAAMVPRGWLRISGVPSRMYCMAAS